MTFDEWAKEHNIPEHMRMVYAGVWETAQSELRADLAEALMHDCENGIKWMNEGAAAKFAADYPNLYEVLNDTGG